MKTIKYGHFLLEKTNYDIDIIVRIFHWSVVILFVVLFITGYNIDGSDLLHILSGYFLISIVLSRIVWGFIGDSNALWENYIFHPKLLFSYMHELFSSTNMEYKGHNPAGSMMILAMITILIGLVISGLLLQALFEFDGPLLFLSAYFNDTEAVFIKQLHGWLAYSMLLAIVLHVLGVIWSSKLYKINMPLMMINGKIHQLEIRRKYDKV